MWGLNIIRRKIYFCYYPDWHTRLLQLHTGMLFIVMLNKSKKSIPKKSSHEESSWKSLSASVIFVNQQTNKSHISQKNCLYLYTIRKKLHYRVCSRDIDARPLVAEAAGKLKKLQNTECPEESNIRSWACIVRTKMVFWFGFTEPTLIAQIR